jgi:hypothetical protein
VSTPTEVSSLNVIKMAHTTIWAFFVACMLAIWVFAWQARYGYAALMIGIVLIEVFVLALNGWRCPLTDVAGRYTHDRRANFDIYLPAWIARNNKVIFGVLFVAGVALTLARWSYERA